MSAPGVLDVSQHYTGSVAQQRNGWSGRAASSRMSEMERKMTMMVDSSGRSSPSEEHEQAQSSPQPDDVAPSMSAFVALPVEIIERILTFAILPTSTQVSQIRHRESSFDEMVKTSNALPLCLVSKTFDQIVRPAMYRSLHVPQRKVRSVLRTLKSNPTLRSHVRQCIIESHIWTSDIDENVIAELLQTIRAGCTLLHVGANESPLLPYLLHGPVATDDEEQAGDQPSAIRALSVCWRDEVDSDPEAVRDEEEQEEQRIHQANDQGIDVRDTFSIRQTLVTLFEHQGRTISSLPPPKGCMYAHLRHLTLDMYSQAQLDQLFLERGYFRRHLLPLLTFVRLEMPLSVLQCSCSTPGALVERWPTHRTTFESMHDARFIEMKEVVTKRNRLARLDRGEAAQGMVALTRCSPALLRSLLTRFMLNIHRNDTILLDLLLSGADPACQQKWSLRAAVAACVLAHSLQHHLGQQRGSEDGGSPVFFDLAAMNEGTTDAYWTAQWEEAEGERQRCLDDALERQKATWDPLDAPLTAASQSDAIRSFLFLRWPVAQEAFFRMSALAL